ncbi:hypothetical protein A5768_26405 [Mycolicibacterium fortuitum]|uniref:hypothetical protein n=1 Tax=Mycolicibacterium fortuitum TaxID=1766 RepID=UPI0007E9A71C|nr:hypothetical protein [Mycolicibacterium fortuitum]OBG21635.1 hypothetical protein A5768_26405 [Mycolicibacterium fortuitum]
MELAHAPATATAARCTCHSIREGAGGVTFSLAMLGVLCDSCESAIAEYEEQERWDRLTPAQQRREILAGRWAAAVRGLPRRRPGAPDYDVPF